MKEICLMRYSYIGWRWLRYRFSPWWILTSAGIKFWFASGSQRTMQQVRWMQALLRIDLVGFCDLLNDLIF
jgi:hypothetical protein